MDLKLRKLDGFNGRPGPVVIVVMDGVGLGRGDEGDAVKLARTPTLDRLIATCPHTALRAHGTAVGLPSDDDMGNSEVGHNAMGAGRVFDQGAKLVNRAIATEALFEGEGWRKLIKNCRSHKSALHFIGLLSDGNVHSHIDQLVALLRRAAQEGGERVYVHPLLDGRDVPETSGLLYLDQLESVLAELRAKHPGKTFAIASGGGRMVTTMDRYEADWRIVERGWNAHVRGAARTFPSARAAVETYRAEQPGIADQFLPAFVVADPAGAPVGPIRDGDSVVFFNFRGDRAIELSRAFEDEDFDKFPRGPKPKVVYAGMMEYDGDFHIPKTFLVAPPSLDRTMGEYLARGEIPQLAAAETQKFGHVTYFWNGNRGGMFDERYETYVEVPSDRVPFEQRPWMKAAEVTDAVIKELRTGRYRQARLNYANGDMVGHTGVREAAIQAVAAVDLCLGRLLQTVAELKGLALVTADHGNADEMYEWDKKKKAFEVDKATGERKPKTAHTLNPVPFIIYDPAFAGEYELAAPDKPGLGNLAATALNLMGFAAPEGYLPSLVRLKK
ncbi:MAG TPA: 2,3-bisphosphoglycerate-independent phosphoglycerate mutase [Polyangia bacterium]